MSKRLLLLAWLTFGPAVAAAQETGLTIYQDGTVLVRRTLAQPVGRGATTFTMDLATANVVPGSFMTLAEGMDLRTARVLQVTGVDAALRRSVGRDVDFRVLLRDTSYFVRGRLLSVQPFAVRIDGRVLYDMPGQPAFPDSIVQVGPRADITVVADHPAQRVGIGYLTSGLSWRAEMNVIVPRIGGGPAELAGVAVIDNGGIAVRGAQVQLSSGRINRAAPSPRPMGRVQLEEAAVTTVSSAPYLAAPPSVAAEAVAETRLYSLPATLDLEPGVTTTTALFSPVTADVERLFLVPPSGDLVDQWVDRADSNMHPAVVYRLRRAAGTPAGDLAVPDAVWRLLARDSSGQLQLVGEAQLGATPAGRDVELNTGTASDVVVDRIQTTFDRRGDKDVTATFRVTVHNGKDESVTVAVNETAPGRCDVLNSTVPAERVNSSQLRFLLPVPARSEGVLEYRVRVRW